jgi:pimeloyl-ACP methyl ester carboxylesterase
MNTSVTPRDTAATRKGDCVAVGGVRTYYEVTGAGPPLLLLHGGLCTAETLDPQVATLAENYRVLVPERYGHGRTADITGPITYENMAEHMIAFMEELGLESAHIVGWSDGALVGLLVALRRPRLVRKLVLIEQFVTLDTARPEYLPFMATLTADSAPPEFVEMYRAVSPDGPDHFPVVFEKLHQIWTGETGVELADLARVTAPTLLLLGDDGAMTMEQVAAVHRAFPDSQLAIVPGASHGLPLEKPHVVNQLIADFLADDQVVKLFPLDGS